eukprot:jgi/Orpsp1_1/1176037/evm.model.c7180000056173.1
MKNFSLKNIIYFITLSSFALIKAENDCATIKEIIKNGGYINDCVENEQGNVINLSIDYCNEISSENIDKIFAFDTIETLTYHNREIKNDFVPFDKLTHLKELYFINYIYDEFGYRNYYEFSVNFGQFASDVKLPKSIKKLTIEGLEFNQQAINEIATLTDLEEVTLNYCMIDKLDLEAIGELKKLSTLTIRENHANNYNGYLATNVLKHFKHLKTLTFIAVKLNDEHINEISALTHLKELIFKNIVFSNLNFESFENLSNLTALEIEPRSGIPFEENILKYSKNLKKLILRSFKEVTSSLNEDINNLNELEELRIIPKMEYEEYKDKTVQPFDITTLTNLKNLKTLELDGNNIYYNGKFDLSIFKKLRSLSINHGVFQEHIDQMATLTDLEELYLNNVSFENLNLDGLKNLKKLTILEIHSWIISVVTLKEIPEFVYELSNLKKLVIEQDLTGSIPVELTKNKKLEYIGFSSNSFTSIPAELATLQNLKYINICYNDITEIPEELQSIVHSDKKNAEYIPSSSDIENEDDNTQIITDSNNNEDANNEDANNEDANNEEANNEEANNEDANNEDANNEDANNEDANNEGANNEDANNEDANNEDANNEDANNEDANNEGANNE